MIIYRGTGRPARRPIIIIHIYIYIHIIYLSLSLYIYIYIYRSLSIYLSIYLSLSLYLYIYIYIHICIYTYIDMCIHIYIYIYIYMIIYRGTGRPARRPRRISSRSGRRSRTTSSICRTSSARAVPSPTSVSRPSPSRRSSTRWPRPARSRSDLHVRSDKNNQDNTFTLHETTHALNNTTITQQLKQYDRGPPVLLTF